MLYLRSWEAVSHICQALQQEEAPCDICSTSEMVSGEIWKMQLWRLAKQLAPGVAVGGQWDMYPRVWSPASRG